MADSHRYVTLMEHVAVLDPALFLALGVHYGVCLGTLEHHRRSPYVSKMVAELDEMNAVAVILTTELGHGTSQGASRTLARFDSESGDFLLRTPDVGARKFMANVAAPGIPKIGIVYATVMQDDRACGTYPFLVPIRDHQGACTGVHVVGLGDAGPVSLDHGLVSFDDVRVPYEAWLRGSADFDAVGDFHDPLGDTGERFVRSVAGVENMWLGLIAAAGATARASAAVFARYVQQRKTAGGLAGWVPVMCYRNIQEALFGAMAESYALTFVVNETVHGRRVFRDTGAGGRGQADAKSATWTALNRDLALIKVLATEATGRVAARCRERCGAQGVLLANRLVDYEGFAHAGKAIAGDNQLFLLDAARNIVLAGDLTSAPRERSSERGAADLRDPAALLALARLREHRLLNELGRHVESSLQLGASEFDAWNEVLVLACTLMEARGLVAFLESFSAALETADPDGRRLLLPLQILYSIERVEGFAGWYLSEGLVNNDFLSAIPAVKNECYDLLLPSLEVLVHALDVPENLIQAPIMAEDYVTAFPGPAFLSTNHPGK
ncbi:acyl-CoA dehydrogenase [Actinomycetospora cinnamomea]|uniref:Acyl-coenzyme A oxidase n=1 Tax=Actinomycetospora cinnamomea TaxID=663609 RepID=A0A2U1F7L4_9PSEU|nr:acyl-CoA dehydrogenase [Actinomycetospora cinnamomea]PVZ08166.1 acyl-coenzyme A oxidase [Actinomycetospora cinnamomea]